MKICSKFAEDHPGLISIKLQINFIEITLRHECSSVSLLDILGTPFTKNTPAWILLVLNIFHYFNEKSCNKNTYKEFVIVQRLIFMYFYYFMGI